MLTDIFARRYESRVLFTSVGTNELRLLVQAFRIISEHLMPYFAADGKTDEAAKGAWQRLHDQLTMEFGWKELSPRYYSYPTTWNGQATTQSGIYGINMVCEAFVTEPFTNQDPDVFVKNRLSFVELAFRARENQIKLANWGLPNELRKASFDDLKPRRGMTIPSANPPNVVQRTQQANDRLNSAFNALVRELNTRFEQARAPLNYHNGFIQIATDALTQEQIDEPFWALVKDQKWANVDTDMKEAIDRRDTAGRDPALYAAKALESTIKIICGEKGWTTGAEKGASDFLNHLERKATGRFVDPWERELMQKFFGGVRNELGHGPGGEPMPALTGPQTDAAIELCMSWIKSLIVRL